MTEWDDDMLTPKFSPHPHPFIRWECCGLMVLFKRATAVKTSSTNVLKPGVDLVMLRDQKQDSGFIPQHCKYIKSTVTCWDIQTPILNLFCPLKPDLCWHLPLGCCIQIDTYAPSSSPHLLCVFLLPLQDSCLHPCPHYFLFFFFAFPSPTPHTSLYSLWPCLLFILQSQQHKLTHSHSCYTQTFHPSSSIVCRHRR